MALAIKNFRKIVPDAYHGTGMDTARTIKTNNEFKPSTGDEQYLGDGVYFFEGSPGNAKGWAKDAARKSNQNGIGVLRATLELGCCLDYNNKDHIRFIVDVYNNLSQRGIPGINDAIVINFIGDLQKVDSVRASYGYNKNSKIFNGSRFLSSIYIMICMRNLELISNIELVHEELLQ